MIIVIQNYHLICKHMQSQVELLGAFGLKLSILQRRVLVRFWKFGADVYQDEKMKCEKYKILCYYASSYKKTCIV